jgi:aminodeoxyfutalosine synthase
MHMSSATTFDRYHERIGAGASLSPDEVRELAAAPDILSLGMLADVVRRQRYGARTTFLRVAEGPYDGVPFDGGQPAAREVRLTGSPPDITAAVSAVETVKAAAGDRLVSGFSWSDVERWSGGEHPAQVLKQLRSAGLEAIADLPLDGLTDPAAAVESLLGAGFLQLRLAISKSPAAQRPELLLRAGELQFRYGCIQSLNPLANLLATFRPTTGYEDVKMVALARLAAPAIPSIQVDWRRYGPKLAQVALTFGADDIDGVSGSDAAPEGRRRAPLEEIRRNIEAAGLIPVERDGRFAALG